MLETFKEFGRRFPRLRKAYLWVKFAPRSIYNMRRELQAHANEWEVELEEARRIQELGLYDSEEELANHLQPYEGRNFLGLPAAGFIRRSGRPVGWCFGQHLELELGELPFFQSATDVDINIPRLIRTYRPDVVIDFGTAFGASALLFHKLMREYANDPSVMSIDINNVFESEYAELHERNGSRQKVEFFVGDTLDASTSDAVRGLIDANPEARVLLSFDDNHLSHHVLTELRMYAPLLRSQDVILVQDTWNQGLRGSPFSPLLAVLRFLKETDDFALDTAFLQEVTLPCNFVHGVLVRR